MRSSVGENCNHNCNYATQHARQLQEQIAGLGSMPLNVLGSAPAPCGPGGCASRRLLVDAAPQAGPARPHRQRQERPGWQNGHDHVSRVFAVFVTATRNCTGSVHRRQNAMAGTGSMRPGVALPSNEHHRR